MNWIDQTVFYHIYPLGLCGAQFHNDFNQAPVDRLDGLYPWLEHLAGMGINGLYIGPLFESVWHGYDTVDYYNIDRRLGTNQTFARFCARAHELGIKVILDAVFNHVGRGFWAFRDVLEKRQTSQFCGWFSGLKFEGDNSFHDGLTYEGWAGNDSLVKLNLSNEEVRSHLFGAVKQWIDDYQIDGLRLDAADVMDKEFLSTLAGYSKSLKDDFWLMGEVVHGDYTQWVRPGRLDSVTNYIAYKGLYSSFNDHNLFEIAYTLQQQFGANGKLRELGLYSFADNHDVSRVASLLHNPAALLPLYVLMFSMPGVPSIYYGSEFGVRGRKEDKDAALRPALNLQDLLAHAERLDLYEALKKLITIRKMHPGLMTGAYSQFYLTNEQFAFKRNLENGITITAINAADHAVSIDIPLGGENHTRFVDLMDENAAYEAYNGHLHLDLPSYSAKWVMAK
jgi:cyclomaltodextrinase / maltogenic alpha-amylase / neopullulanase